MVSLTAVARHDLHVREVGGPNRGAHVEFFQRFCGGSPGESWCMYWVSVVLDKAYFGKPPLRRTGSCALALGEARTKGYIVRDNAPRVDDLYFYVNTSGHAHHVGIVTDVVKGYIDITSTPPTVVNPRVIGIAGNTSEDGKSSNGDGVYEHEISPTCVFVRLPQ